MCFHRFPKEEDLKPPIAKTPVMAPSKKTSNLKKAIMQISTANAIFVRQADSSNDIKENVNQKSLNEKQLSKIRWVANQSDLKSA